MELVFKKNLEVEPEDLAAIEELEPIQKQQLVIVAKSFQGIKIDFEEGFFERLESKLDVIFEFGMKMVHVFDAEDSSEPLYDAWTDKLDAVYVFNHDTTEEAGATRTQGGFDPVDQSDQEHVELARAFDRAQKKASEEDRL
jgi:hypothetical protein